MILSAQAIALYVAGCCLGTIIGCTPALWEKGLHDASMCAATTSVACATQAIGGCIAPATQGAGNAWKNYAVCLWDRAKVCERDGLARCALAAAVEATGFPGLGQPSGVSGLALMESRSGGVPFQCEPESVKACVTDARIETKSEAIRTVAYCYRRHCTEAK